MFVGLKEKEEIKGEMEKITNEKLESLDTVVSSVIMKFVKRANVGKQKYGTDLDRDDLSVSDWITHAQEELMDGILYLEKLRFEINKKNKLE